MKFDYNLKNYDYRLVIYMVALNVLGVVIMRSAVGAEDFRNPQVFRQIIGSIAGLLICIGLSFIDYRRIVRQYNLIYMASVLMLVGVKIYGTASGHGAVRWIQVPMLGQVQPAEFVKIGVIILTASLICLSTAKFVRFKKIFRIWVFTGIIPAAIVYLVSSNLSSAIIVVLISLLMTFVAYSGYKPYVFLIAIGIVIALAAVMYANSADPDSGSFRLNRIAVWLHPEDYAETTGYQTVQSLYAIGSGGFFGKGLGRSMQKLSFIPEAQNDMIFAVICEELGIFGAILVVSLFIFLLWRILVIARRAPDRFGMLICMGVFFHIAIQVFLNIAVATNLIPNTGVTLPFISYGGSSILFLMYEMGMVLNVSRQIKEQ